MKIREAEPKDWEVIQRLNATVFEQDSLFDSDIDTQWPYSDVGIKYYKDLSSNNYGHCLIAEIESNPVGYIALGFKNFGYRKSKYVEIENMGVLPEYRSQGIGSELMESAKSWAISKDILKLYVSAYSKNIRALDFYKRSGFNLLSESLEMDITL